jgi:hypothetical protein
MTYVFVQILRENGGQNCNKNCKNCKNCRKVSIFSFLDIFYAQNCKFFVTLQRIVFEGSYLSNLFRGDVGASLSRPQPEVGHQVSLQEVFPNHSMQTEGNLSEAK